MDPKRYDDLKVNNVFCNNGVFRIEWSSEQIGFVQLDIIVDKTTNDVRIDHEMMSKEFVKTVFDKFIEKYYE
jgi:hypothetical protein